MKKVIGIVALAGLATAASAQNATVKYEVFNTSTNSWGSSVSVNAGASVEVRLVVDWTASSGSALGLADFLPSIRIDGSGANLDSATLTGAAANPAGTYGRQAPFTFGAQTLTSYNSVVDRLRIDVSGDAGDSTGGQVSLFQNTPSASGTNFNTDRVVTVFRFAYNTSASNLAVRALNINTPLSQIRRGAIRLYATSGSTGPDVTVALTANDLIGATINVVPTPGSMALLGLGGLAALRRRR
jgi:uncharacterized protein (TIGR03382 family)